MTATGLATAVTSRSGCRRRPPLWRRSSRPGAASWRAHVSGWPPLATTRWPGWPEKWGCGCGSCAGFGWRTCILEHGPLGKIHVRMGKGSRGSGPRERLVPMLGDARPLLVWWVQEVRGQFTDEWELPRAVLFPSERGGPIGGDTLATALGQAASQHLRGPVTKLTPHVLRHAYASRLHGECLSAAWRGHRPGRDPAALGAPVAVHHGPLRARRRRGDRKRLPAGRRAGPP